MAGKKRIRWRAEWIWIGLLGLVILLGFWWIPGRRGTSRDTYSGEGEGKKAFFTLARMLHPEVRRGLERLLDTLDEPGTEPGTLCLLGPGRTPDTREWRALHAWVHRGGHLLFAASADDPSVDMGPFGVKISPLGLPGLLLEAGKEEDAGEEDGKEGGEEDGVSEGEPDDEREPSVVRQGNVETELASGSFLWPRAASLTFPEDRAEILLSESGEPQVVRLEIGKGVLVVAASDVVFSNRELANGLRDNGLLAYRIFESVGLLEPIIFDEYLSAAGTPRSFGVLFDPLFRRLTLQAILFALLFGWWKARRFGPVSSSATSLRRGILEHAEALGNLHFKAGSGSHALTLYLEYFRRELGPWLATARLRAEDASRIDAEESKLLARWTGFGKDSIARLMERARNASRKQRLSTGEAANLVRSLATLKNSVEHSKR